jgi:NAD+ kinase
MAAGADVRVPATDAAAGAIDATVVEPDKFATGLDWALSLGGDGTMLRTVDLVGNDNVPVLGVNVGQMGFLNEIEPEDLEQALSRVLAGNYLVQERMLLSVTVTSAGPAAGQRVAFNEAVLEKVSSGHLVRLVVSINGKFFTTYAADGVIVSTPTGSTAYNFSARGPIVSPTHRCLLLTPVSPHMLFDHSLVMAPDETLAFEVAGYGPVGLVLDGREVGRLAEGDTVTCTEAPQAARLITFRPRDFHQVLKAKFGLAERPSPRGLPQDRDGDPDGY